MSSLAIVGEPWDAKNLGKFFMVQPPDHQSNSNKPKVTLMKHAVNRNFTYAY